MWTVDSSWLYAFFDAADAHHGAARAEASAPGAWLVNPVALVETLDLVRHRTGRATSVRFYETLLGMGQVHLVGAPKPAVMARLMAQHGGISWQDASVLATALDEGADLRTFDKDQRKAFEALR